MHGKTVGRPPVPLAGGGGTAPPAPAA